jgi:hypothetical protein
LIGTVEAKRALFEPANSELSGQCDLLGLDRSSSHYERGHQVLAELGGHLDMDGWRWTRQRFTALLQTRVRALLVGKEALYLWSRFDATFGACVKIWLRILNQSAISP